MSGEAAVVDKVMLRRSIMSCSFVVLTGAGGSARTNALLGVDVVAAEEDGSIVLLVLTNAKLSLFPPDVFGGGMDRGLKCLRASCANSSSSSSSSSIWNLAMLPTGADRLALGLGLESLVLDSFTSVCLELDGDFSVGWGLKLVA